MPTTDGSTTVFTIDELIFPNNVFTIMQAMDAKRPLRIQITGPTGFTLWKELREEFERGSRPTPRNPDDGGADVPTASDTKKEALKKAIALAKAKELAKQKALAASRRKKAIAEAKKKALAMARAEASGNNPRPGATLQAREAEIEKAFALAENNAFNQTSNPKLTKAIRDLLEASERKLPNVPNVPTSPPAGPRMGALLTGVEEIALTVVICTTIVIGMGLTVLGSVCLYGMSVGYTVVAKQKTRGEGLQGVLDFVLNLELRPPASP